MPTLRAPEAHLRPITLLTVIIINLSGRVDFAGGLTLILTFIRGVAVLFSASPGTCPWYLLLLLCLSWYLPLLLRLLLEWAEGALRPWGGSASFCWLSCWRAASSASFSCLRGAAICIAGVDWRCADVR